MNFLKNLIFGSSDTAENPFNFFNYAKNNINILFETEEGILYNTVKHDWHKPFYYVFKQQLSLQDISTFIYPFLSSQQVSTHEALDAQLLPAFSSYSSPFLSLPRFTSILQVIKFQETFKFLQGCLGFKTAPKFYSTTFWNTSSS